MGRSTRLACVAGSMVLAATLSACGGDDSSAGAAPSEDPTALPSVKPAGVESARHFLKRWAAATARMETTGKTAQYRALTRDCQTCRGLADNIAKRYAAGGYIRWKGLRIDSIETPPNPGGVVLYTVHGYSAPMTLKDSSSRPEQHLPGRRVTYLVGVMSRSKSLSVTSVTYG